MKVRYIKETNFCLTKDKAYKVLREYDDRYKIKDDEGDVIRGLKRGFKVVKSKQLKVGDTLLAKDLNDWCVTEPNQYRGGWRTVEIDWVTDRTIEAIEIKDGHKAFILSGTHLIWVRAKGYRKFCKR